MNKQSIRDMIVERDNRIYDLSLYKVTHGMIIDYDEEEFARFFNYHKQLILRKSFTIEELEDRVYSEVNGIHISSEPEYANMVTQALRKTVHEEEIKLFEERHGYKG